MKVLTNNLLEKYHSGFAYEIFHSYHPLDDPNRRLIYKKTVPDNLKQKTEKPVAQPSVNNNSATAGLPATDPKPQSEFPYAYNKNYQTSPKNIGTHSSSIKIPPRETIPTKSPQDTQPSSREYQQEKTYVDNNSNQEHTFSMPNINDEASALPSNGTEQSSSGQESATTDMSTEERFHANDYQASVTNNKTTYPTEVKEISQTTTRHSNLNQPENEMNRPKNVLTHEVSKSNHLNAVNDENAELYEQIAHVSQELDWIHKVNSFELAFKKDLRNLPIPALRVFSIENAEEMLLPFNDGSLLHDVSSITITKDMCIMLLFRNNSPLKLVPENWYNNGTNRTVLLKNGFNYFYKSVDANQLKETLKILSVDYSSTSEFTQFILKTIPFVPTQNN
ncbi:hypothetical protein [Lactobacillus crispatus]|uniref:hypothetical protein n=1 Tax=Lactobacillus crispatus TaxID=47770 RepID=UPI0014306230|nr:hypothetical protein [Lactobacillus crispatus]NJJ53461.1 hypothetical protein [Lactobacillus crispatus]